MTRTLCHDIVPSQSSYVALQLNTEKYRPHLTDHEATGLPDHAAAGSKHEAITAIGIRMQREENHHIVTDLTSSPGFTGKYRAKKNLFDPRKK